MKKTTKTCCICGATYTGWGNNAWPINNEGRCCDMCNVLAVIPARLRAMKNNEASAQ